MIVTRLVSMCRRVEIEVAGYCRQVLVVGPEWDSRDPCGCQQMHVHPAEAFALKALSLEEARYFIVTDERSLR